ncbi:hypothetical protein IOC57_05400 [Bacillus sp. SD075]|uniref:hypothetical protein n=1 Tax=Bacillus sp. SD075 TaxID=2781732 RepID=UPI001A958521|nr:hypothetical protein [Bacillus sp. SD075]MBO0997200.1 hypothetical protein [Bacillus sp. SD075]
MNQVQVPVDIQFSYFHFMDMKPGVCIPTDCMLPLFTGMPSYSPIITLSSNCIGKNLNKNTRGVYVILIWHPQNILSPVYVGSGDIYKRLTNHINFLKKGNNFMENSTPKYFYELLEDIDQSYWMVTWNACDNERFYENEVYHALNNGPYLVNARATIKDERSYCRYQNKKAEERVENIRILFNPYIKNV